GDKPRAWFIRFDSKRWSTFSKFEVPLIRLRLEPNAHIVSSVKATDSTNNSTLTILDFLSLIMLTRVEWQLQALSVNSILCFWPVNTRRPPGAVRPSGDA